jgi:hypothetical protein
MAGFLSLLATLDPSTQAGYHACLAVFKQLYPEGVIDDTQGQVILTVGDQVVRISGDDMYAVGTGVTNAEQLVKGWFGGGPVTPVVIRRDPGKVLDVPFLDTDGKWKMYSGPFEFKVACDPPADAVPISGVPTAKETKQRTIEAIGRILGAQPPKTKVEVADFQALAVIVNAFPE